MHSSIRACLSLCALLGLLFYYLPEIDMTVAGFFFSADGGFLFDRIWTAKLLQPVLKWTIGIFVTICIAKLVINNWIRPHPLKSQLSFFLLNRSILYLLLALALGPGLFVNEVMKDNWGRARPRDVVEFGGNKQFTRAFVISNQCESNCSFVSGEAAIGFYGLTFLFVARRRRKMIVLGSLLLGSLIGFVRMSLGAHFLSDIVFSGVFTFLISYLLYFIVLRPTHSLRNNHGTDITAEASLEKRD
jgi:lipid A 4'-phosphatase